jgi:hypothetical protein
MNLNDLLARYALSEQQQAAAAAAEPAQTK